MHEMSLENKFYAWLSGQVSPAQLSNIYEALAGIDNFCRGRMIIKTPLFQTTERTVLLDILNTVENDPSFGQAYKRQRSLMIQAIRWFIDYVNQMENQTEADKSTVLDTAASSDGTVQDTLIQLLIEEKIPFVDLRHKEGCLWMFGGTERQEFVNRCKQIGVQFIQKSDGLRATGGEPAWWTKDNVAKVKSGVSKQCEDISLTDFFTEELFTPLRDALIRTGIKNVKELKEVKLWRFMNRYNLYSIAARQDIFSRVQHMLQKLDNNETKEDYSLSFQDKTFLGSSYSHVLLRLCENLAKTYPLKFRTCIGLPISPGGPVVLNKQNHDDCLHMDNPSIFLDANMNRQLVLDSAAWLLKKCMGFVPEITLNPEWGTGVVQYPHGVTGIKSDDSNVKGIIAEPVPETYNTKPSKSNEITRSQQLQIEKVYQFALKADLDGVTFEALKDMLGTTMIAVKELVSIATHLVEIKGRVYHEDAFIDWNEGAETLDSLLDKLMSKNSGYVSAAQLYEYARVEMRMFLDDNGMNDERAVYDIAQHLFEDGKYKEKCYVFTGKTHISEKTSAIANNFDIFCKYADDQGGVFSYSDLVEYLNGIGIKTGNLRSQLKLQSEARFFYYSEGMLVASSKMHIDDEWKRSVKTALDKLFADVGDHIILRDIQDIWFDQLPSLPNGIKWTPLLLQSILRFYGQEFNARTIIAMDTQSIETVHTMLVQLNSPIQNFGDVVICYLLENEILRRSFEAEELRAVLVKSKIIQGNELIYNMQKALGKDERFSWDIDEKHVTIMV